VNVPVFNKPGTVLAIGKMDTSVQLETCWSNTMVAGCTIVHTVLFHCLLCVGVGTKVPREQILFVRFLHVLGLM